MRVRSRIAAPGQAARTAVQVLLHPAFVRAVDAVLDPGRVRLHPGLDVPAEKGVDQKLEEELLLLLRAQEVRVQPLLPAREPRHQRVDDVFEALVLDVGEGRLLQIADLVRGDAVDGRDLAALVLPRFQELGVFGAHPHLRPLHSLFQERQPVDVVPAGGFLEAFLDALRRVGGELPRVLQDSPRAGPVREQAGAVLFGGQREPDRLAVQRDRVQPQRAIRRKAAQVEDALLRIGLLDAFHRVPEPEVGPLTHRHPIRMERDQLAHLRADDGLQRVGVAAHLQMTLHHLPPLERRLPRVRLGVADAIESVVGRAFLAPVPGAPVEDQRKLRDVLRKHPNAGVDRRAAQRRVGGDRDPAPGATAEAAPEHAAEGVLGGRCLGRMPWAKDPIEKARHRRDLGTGNAKTPRSASSKRRSNDAASKSGWVRVAIGVPTPKPAE